MSTIKSRKKGRKEGRRKEQLSNAFYMCFVISYHFDNCSTKDFTDPSIKLFTTRENILVVNIIMHYWRKLNELREGTAALCVDSMLGDDFYL